MKKLIYFLSVVGVIFSLSLMSGCLFNHQHNKRHWFSLKQDVHEMHHFIDRHFLNYDYEDPKNW